MGRSASVLLPVVATMGLAIAACPNACIDRGSPNGLEWVVDERTGCCVERIYRRDVDPLPRPYCTCTCDGSVCSVNEPVSSRPGNPANCSDGVSFRCATHTTIDLACDSTQ